MWRPSAMPRKSSVASCALSLPRASNAFSRTNGRAERLGSSSAIRNKVVVELASSLNPISSMASGHKTGSSNCSKLTSKLPRSGAPPMAIKRTMRSCACRGLTRGAGAERIAQGGHQFLSHRARQIHQALHVSAIGGPVETRSQIFRRAARHALQQNFQSFQRAVAAQRILYKFRHALFQSDAGTQALHEHGPLVFHRIQRIERL